MPKVIYMRPLVGTLDGHTFTELEMVDGTPRFLSPELTDEQAARYLTLSGFMAEEIVEDKPPVPDGPIVIPPVVTPVISQIAAPEVKTKGGDSNIQKGPAKNTAAKKTKTPAARETPAERKARLAAESKSGAE